MINGPILFASDDSPAAMMDAKAYIARFGLTQDDVRLMLRNGQTLIMAKRDVSQKIFVDNK